MFLILKKFIFIIKLLLIKTYYWIKIKKIEKNIILQLFVI